MYSDFRSVISTKMIKCYLEGCSKDADEKLVAFCCQEHKDKYWKTNEETLDPDKKKHTLAEVITRAKQIAFEIRHKK
jgi:hypothetical protein